MTPEEPWTTGTPKTDVEATRGHDRGLRLQPGERRRAGRDACALRRGEPMNEERLANTLKLHRARLDLTQAALADRIGVTRKSINAIERGRYVPSTVLALRLARVFGVPVEELFRLPESVDTSD